MEGRIQKLLKEVTLNEQPFIKNPDVTIKKHVAEHGAEIKAFLRYELGQGIEKKEEDFAAEVMSAVGGSK